MREEPLKWRTYIFLLIDTGLCGWTRTWTAASVSEKPGHSDKAVTLRMYTHAGSESIKRAGDIFRTALEAAENGE